MLTKYYIEIDDIATEIPQGCIKNWDEIKCVFKRTDFSGVTRSFTTQFEFVGEMYDKLIALYMRDGVNASATLSLYTITNEWRWELQFSSDLDFSSITWDNNVVKLNCIDDSLAALIKAKKSTKYEMVVGEDVPVAGTLVYDRLIMPNSVSHGIMSNGNDSEDNALCQQHNDGSVVLVGSVSSSPPSSTDACNRYGFLPVYTIGDAETYENSPVSFGDETGDWNSYFLKIEKPADCLDIDIEIDYNGISCFRSTYVINAEIILVRFDASNPSTRHTIGQVCKINESRYTLLDRNRECLGCFPSLDVLKEKYPKPKHGSYAIIGKSKKYSESEAVYFAPDTVNAPCEWTRGEMVSVTQYGEEEPIAYCRDKRWVSRFDLSSYDVGTCFALMYRCEMAPGNSKNPDLERHFAIKSKINTKWTSKGNPISVPALNPTSALNALMFKMGEGKINIDAQINTADPRLANTYLFAAESVRNIPGAKFYTSFNEFCDWMETVFGYTYYLGPRAKASFKRIQEYAWRDSLPTGAHLFTTECPGAHGNLPIFVNSTPYFAVAAEARNADGTLNYYTKWEGSDAYNDPITGKARIDTLFYDSLYKQGIYLDSAYTPHAFSGDVERGLFDTQTIHFVPRTQIFAGENKVVLSNARDLSFNLNSGIAYSALTIGYDKKEYEAECGRDEWNFSAQYTTGIEKDDKRLSLISKYRADCYGFEFLSQERAKDTTDNKSDNDVFFILCKQQEDVETETTTESRGDATVTVTVASSTKYLTCDRTAVITGTISDAVFNGDFSPARCAKTNSAYIAASKCPMTLKFASFDGNTDISIDGVRGDADIQLTNQLFTLGELEFSSPDVDTDLDVNALYEVESNGITYRGFLKEVSFKYAKAQAAKYKLIVKEVELCN